MRARRTPPLLLALLLALVACERGDAPRSSAAVSPRSRAALVIEPPVLRIGDVATAELVVVTPPDHRPLPFKPPEVPGAWLLDVTPEPVEMRAQSWVHRTRIRIRPRDIGVYDWPEGRVVVEETDGARATLDVPARRFEVVSVLPSFAERKAPFGLRAPAAASGGGFWLGTLTGAGATVLALLTALAALRLRRSADDRAPDDEPAPEAVDSNLSSWARGELATTRASAASPGAAANACAKLLRRFMARRFGVPTEAVTTQELRAKEPPLGARSLWPEFVRILQELDAQRFRPRSASAVSAGDEAAAREALERTLAGVERFFAEAAPPGAPTRHA